MRRDFRYHWKLSVFKWSVFRRAVLIRNCNFHCCNTPPYPLQCRIDKSNNALFYVCVVFVFSVKLLWYFRHILKFVRQPKSLFPAKLVEPVFSFFLSFFFLQANMKIFAFFESAITVRIEHDGIFSSKRKNNTSGRNASMLQTTFEIHAILFQWRNDVTKTLPGY